MDDRQLMFWTIRSFPKCAHHAFLSHCAEDRDGLVFPVHRRLTDTGVVPWLDQEDYYYGRDSRTALRDGVLRSRHVVFFVTDAVLSTARGWCIFELAFAELLELNAQLPGRSTLSAYLPLFFVRQTDERLPRSVWQATRDRGQFAPVGSLEDQVGWSVNAIREYLLREQHLSREFASLTKQDPVLKTRIGEVPGLLDRVTKFHPTRLQA